MLYCPNFFWNVLQVWMTGKDVYLQMTWSWPDKTWNILCSYCLQWNTSQNKFRNHYFLFLFAFSILSQLFLIWGCKTSTTFLFHTNYYYMFRLSINNKELFYSSCLQNSSRSSKPQLWFVNYYINYYILTFASQPASYKASSPDWSFETTRALLIKLCFYH